MLDFSRVQNYYIACGYTDMRKQIDGLAALVCECQRKSEPSANQYLSHLCERILEPPTPKVTANT